MWRRSLSTPQQNYDVQQISRAIVCRFRPAAGLSAASRFVYSVFGRVARGLILIASAHRPNIVAAGTVFPLQSLPEVPAPLTAMGNNRFAVRQLAAFGGVALLSLSDGYRLKF